MPKKTEREDPLGVFNIHFVAKHQKIEGGKLLFSEKNLTVPKKTERGALWDFPTSILSQNSKKIEGGPFGEKIPEKKSRSAEKNWKGGPFGLAWYGMLAWYAGKQEKPFWFSSLGQMVQFGAIIFCRTFVELFWSVQVVLKKLTKSHDYSRLFSKKSAD